MFRHQKRTPGYNDLVNQPSTSQNQPMAAPMDYQTHMMRPTTYQNPLAHQNPPTHHNPHYSSPQNLHPQGGPEFNGVKCGGTSYNKQQLLDARNGACSRSRTVNSRMATLYTPANLEKYTEEPPFFLYPLGNQIMNFRGVPHFGIDRLVVSKSCQIVGAVSEWPLPREFANKAKNLILGRPLQLHDQKQYKYTDCTVF
ncbi:hypothetical protein EPUL_006333 [Erysiphe pulchra]|uniref:Uncharacterized protein n=1 Tax=Erysiphe pulchra TaxID=225359 RepID=A0A2S4PJD7_9PEZI|nr:hypothetical protein EPUL_006333 [Erysiphe pulchra]